MTRRLLMRPQARVDLLDIWHFIATDNPARASRVCAELERTIRQLAETPGIGHTREDVHDPRYRFWTVFSYVIAYRYDKETLVVMRVLHGRRDLRRLFADR